MVRASFSNYRFSLQLELSKSLGVEWLHTADVNKKCRIRSAINNDVHVLEIDSQAAPFQVCNQLWNLCSY